MIKSALGGTPWKGLYPMAKSLGVLSNRAQYSVFEASTEAEVAVGNSIPPGDQAQHFKAVPVH